jgi:hypothetical protein
MGVLRSQRPQDPSELAVLDRLDKLEEDMLVAVAGLTEDPLGRSDALWLFLFGQVEAAPSFILRSSLP